MDFRTLQYFVTVAEELNFTKAAEKLHMTQPPLSKQIQELEEDLNVELFIRGRRKLKLTEEGSLLYQRSLQMLELSETTRSELASLHDALSGKLHIGLVGGRTPVFAAHWISDFNKMYPSVRFTLHSGGTDDILKQMRKGKVSMGIIAAPYDHEDIDGITVDREPWTAVLPVEHPLLTEYSNQNTIPLQALAGQSLIIPHRKYRKSAIRQWFRSINVVPKILCEMSDYLDAVALVEQGTGIAIFPHTTYTPNALVETRLITDPAKFVEYVFVWNRNETQSVLARTFIEFVRNYLSKEKPFDNRSLVPYEEFQIPPDAELL